MFRRGIPITKRRRYNEIQNADAVWFLPIQRPMSQKLKDIPDHERTTLLFSSEMNATRVSRIRESPVLTPDLCLDNKSDAGTDRADRQQDIECRAIFRTFQRGARLAYRGQLAGSR